MIKFACILTLTLIQGKCTVHVALTSKAIMFLRARLHYMTKPCDMDSLITFNKGLGPLKTKSGGGIPGRGV